MLLIFYLRKYRTLTPDLLNFIGRSVDDLRVSFCKWAFPPSPVCTCPSPANNLFHPLYSLADGLPTKIACGDYSPTRKHLTNRYNSRSRVTIKAGRTFSLCTPAFFAVARPLSIASDSRSRTINRWIVKSPAVAVLGATISIQFPRHILPRMNLHHSNLVLFSACYPAISVLLIRGFSSIPESNAPFLFMSTVTSVLSQDIGRTLRICLLNLETP